MKVHRGFEPICLLAASSILWPELTGGPRLPVFQISLQELLQASALMQANSPSESASGNIHGLTWVIA